MQMNGSAKVSAPRCTSYSSGTIVSLGGNISNGDSVVNTAYTSGTSLVLASSKGFGSSGKVIIGYGSTNEEEVAFSDNNTTTSTLTITAATKAHAKNERVVLKPTVSFMPGTVKIQIAGDEVAADDGAGTLVSSDALFNSGTVDYATGRFKANLDTQTDAVTLTASVLSDAPDAAGALADGSAAHKTFQQYVFTKNDAPGSATVSNLGDATVGFFFEVSRNGGKSFTSAGLASSGSIGALGSTTVTCPGGRDQVVRFRAGSQVADSTFEGNQSGSKDPEGRIIEPRVVTVDTATKLNHG